MHEIMHEEPFIKLKKYRRNQKKLVLKTDDFNQNI